MSTLNAKLDLDNKSGWGISAFGSSQLAAAGTTTGLFTRTINLPSFTTWENNYGSRLTKLGGNRQGDLWLMTTDLNLFKWMGGTSFQIDTANMGGVIDFFVRDKVYVVIPNQICVRSLDVRTLDHVCTRITFGPIMIAVSDSNLFAITADGVLYSTRLPLTPATEFFDTGFRSRNAKFITVPLDESAPVLLDSDGNILSNFCGRTGVSCFSSTAVDRPSSSTLPPTPDAPPPTPSSSSIVSETQQSSTINPSTSLQPSTSQTTTAPMATTSTSSSPAVTTTPPPPSALSSPYDSTYTVAIVAGTLAGIVLIVLAIIAIKRRRDAIAKNAVYPSQRHDTRIDEELALQRQREAAQLDFLRLGGASTFDHIAKGYPVHLNVVAEEHDRASFCGQSCDSVQTLFPHMASLQMKQHYDIDEHVMSFADEEKGRVELEPIQVFDETGGVVSPFLHLEREPSRYHPRVDIKQPLDDKKEGAPEPVENRDVASLPVYESWKGKTNAGNWREKS
ncbi:hypothetical protein HDU97_008804 [Phlyctochytrium planicorne]|nr:hypothetical protein HDU97_008804 [Phlyctochytrium planicorne]